MMCYSVEPRDRIFVKVYGFLSCTKAVNIARHFLIMLNICNRCTWNFFKKSHSKTAEATSNLIGNKIADRIRKVLKN